MILKLPHRNVKLDFCLSFEDRNNFIKLLLQEDVGINRMNLGEYFGETWFDRNSIKCMDIISYYLTKGNTEGEDREILSTKKERELQKGSKRHTTFTSLDYNMRHKFGITEKEDSYN